LTTSAHKTEGVNRTKIVRSYPFVSLPERMRTACDRSGANGNGASSRGTRRTDNARGQLEAGRFLCWTEDVAAQSERRAGLLAFPSQSCVGAANRLQGFMETGDEGGIAAYYNYTADGERNIKLTSPRLNMHQNASQFNNPPLFIPTLYASPLITLTPKGYTKHYFEEGRRVCSKLGGWFLWRVPADDILKPVEEVKDNYEEQHNQQRQGVHETFGKCIGAWPELIDKYDLLKMLLKYKEEEKNFYYHSDHLGSAAYLTSGGDVTQTLNYLPYGEDWIDVQNNMDPRLGQYRFNGKEKDYESGFHYYGARYYWSELLTGWLSVDPMMDKYPGISPYNYCMWNPVKLVDPDGNIVLPYPGSKPEFIDYLNQVKAYLYANHSGDIIRQLDMLPIIIYVKEISFEEALEGRMAYNRNTNTIKWHPLAGLYTDENHLLSPTTVLNHEFDHALRYLLKPNQFIQDLITDDNSYDNREEERVITGSERQTAINLGEIFPWQITRKFHLGAAVKVKSPTSIEVQPPYRINSPIKELEEIEVNDSLDY